MDEERRLLFGGPTPDKFYVASLYVCNVITPSSGNASTVSCFAHANQIMPLPGSFKSSALDTPSALQGTPSLEELKLIYYRSFIRYHSHHNDYLEICRCYRAIYETDSIAADEAKWKPVSFSAVCRWECQMTLYSTAMGCFGSMLEDIVDFCVA